MPFKATPGVYRTPRTQAEKIGTAPGGFTGHVNEENYNVRGGHPITSELPNDDYAESPQPVGPGQPRAQHVPFKVGG